MLQQHISHIIHSTEVHEISLDNLCYPAINHMAELYTAEIKLYNSDKLAELVSVDSTS